MDILGLAKVAGFTLTNGSYWQNVKGTDTELRRFAEMVATAERERCRQSVSSAFDETCMAALTEKQARSRAVAACAS